MSELLGGINWTSVEDALPPENSYVIVYFADRGSVMTCHYYKDFSLARCEMSGFEPHGVTHWAEIKPPNGKAKGQCPTNQTGEMT